MMKINFKKILVACSMLLISCASEDSNSGKSNNSNNQKEIKVISKNVNLVSNFNKVKYLVEIEQESLLVNSVNTNDTLEITHGVTTSDQIILLIEDIGSGFVTNAKKSGDSFLYEGLFSINNGEFQCVLVFESGDLKKCLLEKQEAVSSFSANFYKDDIVLLISNNSNNSKVLYEYRNDTGYISHNISYDFKGEIKRSYSSLDSVGFLMESQSGDNYVASIQKQNNLFRFKEEPILKNAIIEKEGATLFMTNKGYLRQGWSKIVAYTKADNRRIFSEESGNTFKTDYFTFFIQKDFVTKGVSKSLISYLRPKREDLSEEFPDFILRKIPCCNVTSVVNLGVPTLIAEFDWKQATKYNNFILAYGETLGENSPEFKEKTVIVDKVIILMNGNDIFMEDGVNPRVPNIDIHDYANPEDDMDNLYNTFGFDTVTNIETYLKGFKVTGVTAGVEEVVYYNPKDNTFEEPLDEDMVTYKVIKTL